MENKTEEKDIKIDVTHHVVSDDEAGMRLDRWLTARFPALSHNHVSKLLRKGQIRLDGKRVEGNTRLAAWASVRMPPLGEYADAKPIKGEKRMPAAGRARELQSWIIYEDDDVVVLNKPAGIAVQGGTRITRSIDDDLLALQKGDDTPKLVHRLDRETSGVLVIARTDFAARALSASFRSRETGKYYLALVAGEPEAESGTIKAPLLKGGDGRVRVLEDGQYAESDFYVVDRAFRKASAVLLRPHTGRTHQLRVHCEFMGTPILGDPIYENDKSRLVTQEMNIKTMHLHAWRLIIPHPRKGQKKIDVTAPLSKEQSATWQQLGFSTKLNLNNILDA